VAEVRGWRPGKLHNPTQLLGYCCERLEARGKEALLLIWDNASSGIRAQSSEAGSQPITGKPTTEGGCGVRIVPCLLPTKSPWLNAIEPKWIDAKRKVVEPERLLGAYELADRVCGAFGCIHEPHLSIPQEVA
jgi:hypothetical protein